VELFVYNPDQVAGLALCNLLRLRKWEPIYYANAEQLAEKLRFATSGILILDCASFSILSNILKDLKLLVGTVPVILLTPFAQNEKEIQRLQQQGYHVLEKPVVLDELVKMIQQIGEK